MARRKSETSKERRSPMGVATHERSRGERGRTSSTKTPVTIRNTTSSELDREWVHQRLGFKLGKFAARIDRANITIGDESGPTGASVLRATIQLAIPRRESIVVTARGATAQGAVASALQSAERAVRRASEHRATVQRGPSSK